jgi:hypothetical protein
MSSNQYDPLSWHQLLWFEISKFRYGIKSTFRFLTIWILWKINMYSLYQIQAAISPSVYTIPLSNFYDIKPVSSSFMAPNFMMWNLIVSIWDQVNFSIFTIWIMWKIKMYSRYQIKFVISPLIYTSPSSNIRPSNQYRHLTWHQISKCQL